MDNESSPRTIERVGNIEIPVIYANSIEVGISLFDVTLILGTTLVATAERAVIQQTARVIVSPQHAKVLAKILNDNLADYESKFGAIPVDPDDSSVTRNQRA